MSVVSAGQLVLRFEPSIRQRFPTLRQCLHYVVLQDKRGIKQVAADCDLSESELSRRLGPKTERDPRSCDVDDVLVAVMKSCKNLLPLEWLVAEFGQDDESRAHAAISRIEQLMPEIMDAVAIVKKGRKK